MDDAPAPIDPATTLQADVGPDHLIVALDPTPPYGATDVARVALLACLLSGVIGAVCCPIGLGALVGLAIGILAIPALVWFEKRARERQLRIEAYPEGVTATILQPSGERTEKWTLGRGEIDHIERGGLGLVLVHPGDARRTELPMGGHSEPEVAWVQAQLEDLLRLQRTEG